MIKNTQITIQHQTEPQPPFMDSTTEEITVTGLVQALNTSEDNTSYESHTSTENLIIHVQNPEYTANYISTGDTFNYKGDTYNITSVKPTIMDENIVVYLPYKWQINAKRKVR